MVLYYNGIIMVLYYKAKPIVEQLGAFSNIKALYSLFTAMYLPMNMHSLLLQYYMLYYYITCALIIIVQHAQLTITM